MIVDDFVLRVGLDPAKYQAGQKEIEVADKRLRDSAEKTGKELEERGTQAARFFGSIKSEALSLFAVVVGAGGIESFAARTVTSLNATARAAKLTGQSLQDLIAYQRTLERSGADPKAGGASFTSIANAMQSWRTGQGIDPHMLMAFNQIGGVNPNSSPIEIFRKFSQFAATHTGQRASQIGGWLGLDEGSIALATRGRGYFDAQMAKSRSIPGLPSDQDASKINDLTQAFFGLRQEIGGDAFVILNFTSGPLTGLFKAFTALDRAGGGIPGQVLAISAAIVTLGAGLKVVMGILGIAGAAKAAKVARVAAGAGEVAAASETGGVVGAMTPVVIGGALIAGLGGASMSPDSVDASSPEGQRRLREAGRGADYKAARVTTAQIAARLGGGGATAAAVDGGNGSRADRNNNPGNLMRNGQYLSFPTREAGFAAMARQILIDYNRHGQHTVRELINDPHHGWANQWSPGNTAAGTANYIASVARSLGIGADQAFGTDSRTLTRLMLAMNSFERGPGRRRAASGGQTTVTIGSIVVNGAHDAHATAKAIGGAIRDNLARQGNTGLSG